MSLLIWAIPDRNEYQEYFLGANATGALGWQHYHLYVPTVLKSGSLGWGCQISRQSAHKGGKVVSPTHRPHLPPGNISGTHYCQRLYRAPCHSAAGRIMSKKNSSDNIGNRNSDLLACSAASQPLRASRSLFSTSHFRFNALCLVALYYVNLHLFHYFSGEYNFWLWPAIFWNTTRACRKSLIYG